MPCILKQLAKFAPGAYAVSEVTTLPPITNQLANFKHIHGLNILQICRNTTFVNTLRDKHLISEDDIDIHTINASSTDFDLCNSNK